MGFARALVWVTDMTREQEINYLVTAKKRHSELVARLLRVPSIREVAQTPMAPITQRKTVKAKITRPQDLHVA